MGDDAWMVSRGVDTLILNTYYTDERNKLIKRDLDAALAARLSQWKREAQELSDQVATSLLFNGARLQMCPNGAFHGQYPWMLKTPEITLYVSTGKWNGIAAVRCNAPYLWSARSLLTCLKQVQGLVDEVFGEAMYLQVSAVDLCADIAGWSDITSLDRCRNFVSRSRKRAVHREAEWLAVAEQADYTYGLKATGFDFSRRGPVSCVIYDKTREMERSEKPWFADLWRANGWSEEDGPVWRVELRYRREALHELKQEGVFWGVEDAYKLPDLLPVLWAYGVGHRGGGADGLPDGWIRCVLPNGDKTRARWPVHPAWEVVQRAFSMPMEVPEHFGQVVRKRHAERSVAKAVEAIAGYMSSVAAWVGGELASEEADQSVVHHWLAQHIEEYLERTGRDFVAEVRHKRFKLGLPVEEKGA